MDPTKNVNGAGHSSVPLHGRLLQNSKSIADVPIDATSSVESEVKPVQPLNPTEYPSFFQLARDTIADTQFVTEFIESYITDIKKSLGENIEQEVEVLLSSSLKPDNLFKQAMERELDRVGFDLGYELKKRLVANKPDLESAIVLKMLFLLDKQQEVLSEIMIPYIEEREGLATREIVEGNKKFYMRFLKSLEKEDLKEVLNSLNYHEVIRADNLAYSLLEVADPKFILDSLFANFDNCNHLPEADQAVWQEKIQMIALTVLSKESTKDELSDVEFPSYLEVLYSTAVNKRISDSTATLLSKHCPRDAIAFYKDQLYGDDSNYFDRTDLERARRCYAVSHIGITINDQAQVAKSLKNLISEEGDPAVVGTACKMLIWDLGNEGKEALTDLIVNQINNEEISLPLASLSLLLVAKHLQDNKRPCLEIIKDIFSSKFEKGKDLRTAYMNIAENDLCPVSKDSNGLPFDLVTGKDPEMIVDIIQEIGLEKVLQWAASTEDSPLKDNVRVLLNYACEPPQSSRMSSLLSYYVTNLPESETARLVKHLVGMEEVDKKQHEIL